MPENEAASKTTKRVIARRLCVRLAKSTGVGMSTYVLDISIVALLVYVYSFPSQVAIGTGFLIGLTINYLITYYWVFRGTRRNKFTGYAIFAALAIIGIFVITQSVEYLTGEYHMHLLVARTIVAAFVGLVEFLLNTFLNFKLI